MPLLSSFRFHQMWWWWCWRNTLLITDMIIQHLLLTAAWIALAIFIRAKFFEGGDKLRSIDWSQPGQTIVSLLCPAHSEQILWPQINVLGDRYICLQITHFKWGLIARTTVLFFLPFDFNLTPLADLFDFLLRLFTEEITSKRFSFNWWTSNSYYPFLINSLYDRCRIIPFPTTFHETS